MRASRLLSILILLQMRGRLSAEALAEEFEVSVRTIYRDVDQLSAAGVPIYAERGRNGGFQLLDGYRTKLTGFTPAEADALLLAGVGSAASDLGMGENLAAAQLKLLASLPENSGASAQRVASRFHLDPVNWYGRSGALEHLPTLASAVWGEKRIRVRYESWKGVVERNLDPLGLVMKGGIWYLVAAVEKSPRTYRVSNIRALDVIDASFQRPARFDLAKYWTVSAKDFETRLMRERATIEISPIGMQIMREVMPGTAEAIETNHRPAQQQGWLRAKIAVESFPHAARQMLRLGTEVRVVEPPALRAAIAEEARRVAALYKSKPRR